MKIEQMQWSAGTGWQGTLPSPTLGASVQMVLMFGTRAAMKASQSMELCRRRYPHARRFGCSTAGEIQGTEVRDNTVAITAVAFENTRVEAAQIRIGSPSESFEAGHRLVRSLDSLWLRHLFVVSEGLQVNGSELVSGINAALPGGVSVSPASPETAIGYRKRGFGATEMRKSARWRHWGFMGTTFRSVP